MRHRLAHFIHKWNYWKHVVPWIYRAVCVCSCTYRIVVFGLFVDDVVVVVVGFFRLLCLAIRWATQSLYCKRLCICARVVKACRHERDGMGDVLVFNYLLWMYECIGCWLVGWWGGHCSLGICACGCELLMYMLQNCTYTREQNTNTQRVGIEMECTIFYSRMSEWRAVRLLCYIQCIWQLTIRWNIWNKCYSRDMQMDIGQCIWFMGVRATLHSNANHAFEEKKTCEMCEIKLQFCIRMGLGTQIRKKIKKFNGAETARYM